MVNQPIVVLLNRLFFFSFRSLENARLFLPGHGDNHVATLDFMLYVH